MELVLGLRKGADCERKSSELFCGCLSLGPAAELHGPAVLHGKLKGHAPAGLRAAQRGNLPVLLGNERAYLTLALDEELDRNRLDTSRGEAAPDLLPEERGDHVADDAVKEAP